MGSEEKGLPEGAEYLDPSSELLHDVHMTLRSEPFRVVIADDDFIFIEGIAALIREWGEFKLVGKAYTLEETYTACTRYKPEAVMIGATFKGISCAPAVRKMLDLNPDLRIFVLASMGESGHVLDALRAGASGFGSPAGRGPPRPPAPPCPLPAKDSPSPILGKGEILAYLQQVE